MLQNAGKTVKFNDDSTTIDHHPRAEDVHSGDRGKRPIRLRIVIPDGWTMPPSADQPERHPRAH